MKENKINIRPQLEDYQRALESMESLIDVFADAETRSKGDHHPDCAETRIGLPPSLI